MKYNEHSEKFYPIIGLERADIPEQSKISGNTDANFHIEGLEKVDCARCYQFSSKLESGTTSIIRLKVCMFQSKIIIV